MVHTGDIFTTNLSSVTFDDVECMFIVVKSLNRISRKESHSKCIVLVFVLIFVTLSCGVILSVAVVHLKLCYATFCQIFAVCCLI